MAKNIEININNGSSYEILYPKTLGSLVDGKVSSSGNSDVATKLETSRSIRTNLASTSVANFDGTGNITPGVNGVLGVGNGGTGVNSYSSLASQLSSYISSGDKMESYEIDTTGSNVIINYTMVIPRSLIIWAGSNSTYVNIKFIYTYGIVYFDNTNIGTGWGISTNDFDSNGAGAKVIVTNLNALINRDNKQIRFPRTTGLVNYLIGDNGESFYGVLLGN